MADMAPERMQAKTYKTLGIVAIVVACGLFLANLWLLAYLQTPDPVVPPVEIYRHENRFNWRNK